MRHRLVCAVALLGAVSAAPAFSQFKEGDPGGAKAGVSQTHKWQAGIIVNAQGGPCRMLIGYVPVPNEWPEQVVKIVEQDVSPGVKLSYQLVDGGARLMLVNIPFVQAGQEVKALVTFEIKRHAQLPPENKEAFELPDAKSLDISVRHYLAPSPKIEIGDPKVVKAAKEVGADREKAWERVEALYDWVRGKVQYKTGGPIKSSSEALKDGEGGHDEMSALFVAVCRAAKIPARMVWVPQFSYAEFYLLDKKGEGHWIPCAPAGTRTFGEMPDTKPILEKGDNFSPPYSKSKKDRQRYLTEYLAGKPAPNGGQPRVQFVRKQVD